MWRDADVAELELPEKIAGLVAAAANPAEKSDILRLEILRRFGGATPHRLSTFRILPLGCIEIVSTKHPQYSLLSELYLLLGVLIF